MGRRAERRAAEEDRRQEALVEAVTKALQPSLGALAGSPPQGVVTDAVPLVNDIAGQRSQSSRWESRKPEDLPWHDPQTGFGPGVPVGPQPFDPRLPDTGRALPRMYEFPVSWNVPGQGQPLTPFNVLRRFADQVDVVRLCIGVRKKELSSVNWSITIKKNYVQTVANDQGMSAARTRVQLQNERKDDIARLTDFFEKPDRINRLSFSEWLFQALEEYFVLDALSIYPHPDMASRLHSLEILDGSTIKPLLDFRGARPQPPQPAFQQLIWAFPRGEFTLSDNDGNGETMTSDELIYRPRERRSWTPYGFSPTEQALIAGDLYLKRQMWLRAEYSDGAVPAALMIPPEALNWTPEQVRQYEANINADLAGQTQQRKRWRLTPPGVQMNFPGDWAERYNSTLDEYLVKLLCGFYDVMPSEIGFTPKSGLGGAGHQQGEQASTQRIGNKPMLEWLADILNDIMRTYLGAPPELSFAFDLDETEDDKTKAEVADKDVRNGKRTLNDVRVDDGLPPYDFPEADEPMIVTPTGPIFIKGMLEQHQASIAASVAGSQSSVDVATGKKEDPAITKLKLAQNLPQPPDKPEPPDPTKKVDAAPDPIKGKSADADLTKDVSSLGKPGTADDPRSIAHLLNGGAYNLTDSLHHILSVVQNRHDPDAVEWNADHALVHAQEAREHMARLHEWFCKHPAVAAEFESLQADNPMINPELKKFQKFAGKRLEQGKWRDFEFEHVPQEVGDVLNKVLSADLGKAHTRTGPGSRSHQALVKHFGARIAQALSEAFPNLDQEVEHLLHGRAAHLNKAAGGDMFSYDADALTDTMRELWHNGYAAGSESAKGQLGIETAWDTWQPGFSEAAMKIGGTGLQQMLNSSGVTIKSILDTKVEQLGNRMSYAIDHGWSVDQTANDLRSILLDPSRGEMIATTETNRAMTSATLDEYQKHGVEKVEWLLSDGACELCEENLAASPIDIGDNWPNDDPPVHPWCMCALAPVISTEEQ